jgi:hypothetical protein
MKVEWTECPKDATHSQWSGLYVTMNRKGSIVLSRRTFERLGAPKAFALLFDKVNNRIGLKPTGPSMRNAYSHGPHGKYGGRVIYAYRLTQEFGIDLPHTVQFHDAEIDNDGILILDLRTARASNRNWTRERLAAWTERNPRPGALE